MLNRIWLNWPEVSPDWLVPNFNCSAPPPEGFPFQFTTTTHVPGSQLSPLLFAKLNRLALPDRSIVELVFATENVELVARLNRPSASFASPIVRVPPSLKKPGLLMRPAAPEP